MKKKILVLLAVLLLVALTTQVAFAAPPRPVGPSCNMGASWWDSDTGPGPGNANGVEDEERGMYNVHLGTNPAHGPQGPDDWYPKGRTNMDLVTAAQCGPSFC